MDSIVSNRFLFSFQGRIGRFRFLYACFASMIACLVFMVMVALAITVIFRARAESVEIHPGHIFNFPPELPFSASFKRADPGSSALLILTFYAVTTPAFIAGMWIASAATIKRLHDRSRSGWWAIVFVIAPHVLGNISDWVDGSNPLGYLVFAALPLFIWGIVELVFLRGTGGPNRFGPDPLPRAASREPRPGWDQNAELEFAPHSAGEAAGPHVNRGS